jgi:NAD(P)-dependent dehydrogenase (short-subunit alcohol dehydrogenase family)
MGLLAGKTTLITGALGIIGKALVAKKAQESLRRSDPTCRTSTKLYALSVLGYGTSALTLLTCPASRRQSGELTEKLGGVDILVNNTAFVTNKAHEEFSIQEYEDEVRINSSAAFVLSRACSKHMKQKKSGKIVDVRARQGHGPRTWAFWNQRQRNRAWRRGVQSRMASFRR